MTEKWDKIQGKLDLARVSGEFELSGFYCKLKYLLYFFSAATWSDLFETESGILEVRLSSFPKCDFFLSHLCFVCSTNGLKVSHLSVRSLKNSEHLTGSYKDFTKWVSTNVV